MLDWLIVGGGVHGTLLSRALVAEGGVSPDRLAVLDPHDEPLMRWHRCARTTGMCGLRSPVVHHLGGSELPLRRFAREQGREHELHGPYLRPSTALFDAHVRAVIDRFGLAGLRRRGLATGLDLGRRGGVAVESDRGRLEARRVVLALGAGEHPHWPEWARALAAAGGAVDHVFDLESNGNVPSAGASRVAVVGGGLSACEAARAWADLRPGRVILVRRHGCRVHDFDSDPSWLGPKRLRPFRRDRDPARRRRLIDDARHRGSVPARTVRRLDAAVRDGRLRIVEGEILGASTRPGAAGTESELALRDTVLGPFGRIVLATGFEAGRPGGALLDSAIVRHRLPCAPCGYPLVDGQLRWHPGLFVVGPLAELELGPLARNIAGGMLAAERLLGVG